MPGDFNKVGSKKKRHPPPKLRLPAINDTTLNGKLFLLQSPLISAIIYGVFRGMSEFLEPRWPLTPKQSLLVGIFAAGIWLAVDVFLMRLEQDEISSRANPAILGDANFREYTLIFDGVLCNISW